MWEVTAGKGAHNSLLLYHKAVVCGAVRMDILETLLYETGEHKLPDGPTGESTAD